MDTIQEIFFLPPMAVARLGPGETPLESYEWQQDMDAHGNNKTVIRSNITLREIEDRSVTAYLPDPDTIRFRDEGGALPFATVERSSGRVVGSTRFGPARYSAMAKGV